MHPPSGPGAEVLHQARSLLDDLPVVIDHLIIPDSTGGIEEIHARCAADLSAEDARRIIKGALAAHLHIDVPDGIIRVVSGGTKGDGFPGISVRRPSGPAPKIPLPAEARQTSDRRVSQDPRGAGARTGVAFDPAVRAEKPVAPSGGPDRASSAGDRARIRFVGVDQAHDRTRRIRIRVRLGWAGTVFEGEETGADIGAARPSILARATLRAVEGVLASVHPRATSSLTLEGVERVAAFDKEYLVVGAILVTDRDMWPLTGVVPVVEGEERAVVLATLHAVNQTVSAILGRETAPPSPTSTVDPDPVDPFDVWG